MASNSASFDQSHDTASPTPSRLLVLLCAASFALGLNDAFLNPVLPAIARDLGIPIAVAGQLATVTLLVGALVTLILGVLSDFYGRRTFLLGGLAVAGLANIGLALAPTFAWALAGRVLAGFGLVFAINLALVGDWYAEAARDRATARVLLANALAWVAGVPGIAAVAGFLGWRLGVGLCGALCLAAALSQFALPNQLRQTAPGNAGRALGKIWSSHQHRPSLWLALLTSAARGAYWTAFLTYAGGLFQDGFKLVTWQLGPVFTLSAVAYMAGIEVGSRWAARSGQRAVVVLANLGAAALVALVPLSPSLAPALVGFALSALIGGAGYSALLALILQLAPESRGSTLALNNTLTNVGSAGGVAIAGLAIAALGYAGLGLASGLLALGMVLVARRIKV
jgi:DHA1 family inner membrane transport protein